jgi:putative restriction endonuclease
MAKNWDHAAGVVWAILTHRARRRQTTTYGEIAPAIDTNPLNVGRALGPIQDYCLETRLPPLTAIVVGVGGKPGEGFIAWDVDDLDAAQRQVFDWDWSKETNPYGTFAEGETVDSLADEILVNLTKAPDIYAKVRARGVAQRIFKSMLLKAYDSQCAFCGLTFEEALQACHILPWNKSSNSQRLDPRNGLLLCSTHHCLFDGGWITLSRALKIAFCDMKKEYAPYSAVDKALTLSLAGKKPYLPKDKRLWPSIGLLTARHKLDEWVGLP